MSVHKGSLEDGKRLIVPILVLSLLAPAAFLLGQLVLSFGAARSHVCLRVTTFTTSL